MARLKLAIRHNGFLVFAVGRFFFKIAITRSSYKALKAEKNGYQQAKADTFWCKYVLSKGFFFFNISVFPNVIVTINPSFDRKCFFEELKKHSSGKVKIDVLESFLVRNKVYTKENRMLVNKLLYIDSCCLHGDFHSGNVLVSDDETVKVIDWELFPQFGDYRFDLIHYTIYEINPNSWLDGLSQLASRLDKLDYILDGITIDKDIILKFGLWKIQLEIRKNSLLRRVPSDKFNNKYLNAFYKVKEIYNGSNP